MMNIPFVDFASMHKEIRSQLDEAYNRVMDSNYFIQGTECVMFEKEFAEYCDAKYCIGVAKRIPHTYFPLIFIKSQGNNVNTPANVGYELKSSGAIGLDGGVTVSAKMKGNCSEGTSAIANSTGSASSATPGAKGEHAINMSTRLTNQKRSNSIRVTRFCNIVFIRKSLFEIRCKGNNFIKYMQETETLFTFLQLEINLQPISIPVTSQEYFYII